MLLGKAPFDELTLEIRQHRSLKPSIAVNVVAMRADAGKLFVKHRRHS
ncbi:hypothetical protein [Bradyrhizobium sp. CCGB01]|nr:hypothetical protein [Bradyrhizobium sp. CCGB01]MCP3410618.1 hypothetical protein [Bradyrhizobium sp. CCGB01]